jgi:ABC-type antimicrobial peptide transport system permease subunit
VFILIYVLMLINVFNYRKILICFCTSKLVTFLSYHLLYSDVDDNNEKLSLHFSLDFHIELILVEDEPQT